MNNDKFRYLKKLSEEYPDIKSASLKAAELSAVLSLPKGTEHFVSDIHGEHEAFFHVIKNGSGAVRRKIDDALGSSISKEEKDELATIIYYPREKMELINRVGGLSDDEYEELLRRLVLVCRQSVLKYPDHEVREAIPESYRTIIEELLNENSTMSDKGNYYADIISNIITLGMADDFIRVISELIRRMVIARLHITGDIYDRGPGPHFIMDFLEKYHAFDVQWGNHDVIWMGAALGHGACICNILRNNLRYDGLDIIEEGYGINMQPLREFAAQYYKDDPCECFAVKDREITYDTETQLTMKMHKAITIIQFKLEGKLITDNPDYRMDDRLILDKIDFEKGTVHLEGRDIVLKDALYPTVDPNAPYELNEDEQQLVNTLSLSFSQCVKLKRHAELLLSNGSLYLTYNGNLMFHGCVPLNEDGSLKEVTLYGKTYKGKSFYDALDACVRRGFSSDDAAERKKGADILWYLWNAPDAPAFGKNRMATFERYILDDKEAQKEEKNPYYTLINDENVAKMILEEFGLDPEKGIIINGHVPVKQSKGENPVKANGRVFMIDGGFSKAYQKETGIAGYTLTFNSKGKVLAAHKSFTSSDSAIKYGDDIISEEIAKSPEEKRILIRDTDQGEDIKALIQDLLELIDAFKRGEIKEKKTT